MQRGSLADYFESFAAKRLSAVEADALRSNQHEFNGVKELKEMFGSAKRIFNSKILYLSDEDDDVISAEGQMTWYDARESHPTRTEHRLYYQSNSVFEIIKEGDFLIICKVKEKEELLIVIVDENSSTEYQIKWLFGISDNEIEGKVDYKEVVGETNQLTLIKACILEQLGIDASENFIETSKIDILLKTFPGGFPTTKEFSYFARQDISLSLHDMSPDDILLKWMEHEEVLFRTFEKHLIDSRITKGFETVEEFISFSLSVHNRRKSRAGHAFENHLKQIFTDLKIQFSHNKVTENKSRPDFVFPSIEKYHDQNFSESSLYMLAVKTTCKDRWRQVLAEAHRINRKHLITLEPSISPTQTDEMFSHNLSLVVPDSIQLTYKNEQQERLLSLCDFVNLVQ